MLSSVLSGFLLGLLGVGHCLGMCGGIATALGLTQGQRSHLFFYNLGRISSYGLIGLIVGFTTSWLPHQSIPWLRLLAAFLMVAMALYLTGLWRGLTLLERGGSYLWRLIQPLAKSLLPINSPKKALQVGMVWGWLPCGLIYSALGLAALQSTPWAGMATMLAFGLGTLPLMLTLPLLGQQMRHWIQLQQTRYVMAALILAMAAWTGWQATLMLLGHSH